MEKVFEYIHSIIMEGSFSKAAEKLYVTQPTLSTAVRKFEEQIDRKIFDRNSNPIQLTPSGEILHDYIHSLSTLEKETFEKLTELDNSIHGEIRLGATQYFITIVLSKFLLQFKNSYPTIDIKLIEAPSNELPTMLDENKIDIFLSVEKFNSKKYRFFDGVNDILYIAVPKIYLDNNILRFSITRNEILNNNHVKEQQISDFKFLDDVPFILLTKGNNLYKRSSAILEYEQINPISMIEVSQLTTAHQLCMKGFGATITTDAIINDIPDNDEVCYFFYRNDIMKRKFKVIMKKGRYINNALRLFINELSKFQ